MSILLAGIREDELRNGFPGQGGLNRQQIPDAGLGVIIGDFSAGIGYRTFELFADLIIRIGQVDGAAYIRIGFGHLGSRVLQTHDPGANGRNINFRNLKKVFAVSIVHPDRDIAREFDVLFLIMTDGHEFRVIE